MFFAQTIDFTSKNVINYFYHPGAATSFSDNGFIGQTRPIPAAGLGDTILDQDRLYLGGAPGAPNSCGLFRRILVSATTAGNGIPDIDVLRFGYTGIYLYISTIKAILLLIFDIEIQYVALFQLNELQGQSAQSSIDSNYHLTFGSDPLNSDQNDPKWDLVSILIFKGSNRKIFRLMEEFCWFQSRQCHLRCSISH